MTEFHRDLSLHENESTVDPLESAERLIGASHFPELTALLQAMRLRVFTVDTTHSTDWPAITVREPAMDQLMDCAHRRRQRSFDSMTTAPEVEEVSDHELQALLWTTSAVLEPIIRDLLPASYQARDANLPPVIFRFKPTELNALYTSCLAPGEPDPTAAVTIGGRGIRVEASGLLHQLNRAGSNLDAQTALQLSGLFTLAHEWGHRIDHAYLTHPDWMDGATLFHHARTLGHPPALTSWEISRRVFEEQFAQSVAAHVLTTHLSTSSLDPVARACVTRLFMAEKTERAKELRELYAGFESLGMRWGTWQTMVAQFNAEPTVPGQLHGTLQRLNWRQLGYYLPVLTEIQLRAILEQAEQMEQTGGSTPQV